MCRYADMYIVLCIYAVYTVIIYLPFPTAEHLKSSYVIVCGNLALWWCRDVECGHLARQAYGRDLCETVALEKRLDAD